MSLLFSRKCEYAIRAVIHLARKKEAVSVSHLAEELKIPRAFTGKILQELHRAGYLLSHPGSKGGYTLSASPDALTVNGVIAIIDGAPFRQQCILGQNDCTASTPCSMHAWWTGVSEQITEELNKPLSAYCV